MSKENCQTPESNHSWTKWATLIEAHAQAGVQREISEHKAKGNPVFYEEDNKLIMETSLGERFEYKYTSHGVEVLKKLE
jgi:hypothetical protein